MPALTTESPAHSPSSAVTAARGDESTTSTALVGRPGRRAAPPANTGIARELRRRRELLRLSIREAAERTGFSDTVINEIERGQRLPTVRTFERLRRGLGLDASPDILVSPSQPVDPLDIHLDPLDIRLDPLDIHLIRLAACLWPSGGRIDLADLAASFGTSAGALREQLPVVAPRLGECGLALVTDGAEVRLEPLPVAEPALEAMGLKGRVAGVPVGLSHKPFSE